MASRSAAGTAPSTAAAGAPEPPGAVSTSALWQAITDRYKTAQRDAAATMTETNTEVVQDEGVHFVLRVAAKLRDKPKPPAEAAGQPKKEWRNPFLPYEEALWVADLGASHVLLLNKFNIVPWHCLVVTSQFRSQLEDLDAADWAATWAVLQDMPRGGLAFYNCGPVSGASQPHKHMQIVPLPLDGDGGSSGGSPAGSVGEERAQPPVWPAVAAATEGAPAGQPVELRNLPFAAFAARLAPPDAAQDGLQEPLLTGAAAGAPAAAGSDSDGEAAAGVAGAAAVPAATGQYLEQVYCRLLASCKAFVEGKTGVPAASPQDGTLSYNMVCTRDFMMLVPRRRESDGPVSCNSVAFAGSIFVRSVEEVQYVAQRGPLSILTSTGYEW
ncbi:hypothetical protein ABPG77_005419 [Micractinium sp. CCAP 211/92]